MLCTVHYSHTPNWYGVQELLLDLGLSKWVRQRLHHQSSFSQAMDSLRSFAETMMKADVATLDASTNTHPRSAANDPIMADWSSK